MLEFSAMLKGIAAALAAFASAAAGAAIGVGVWMILAWLLSAALVALAGGERGRSLLAWGVFAIVLSPPIAALLLLALPSRAAERERRLARGGKRGLALCPACAEVIRAEARRCRHCREEIGFTVHAQRSGPGRDRSGGKQLIADQRDQDQ